MRDWLVRKEILDYSNKSCKQQLLPLGLDITPKKAQL